MFELRVCTVDCGVSLGLWDVSSFRGSAFPEWWISIIEVDSVLGSVDCIDRLCYTCIYMNVICSHCELGAGIGHFSRGKVRLYSPSC